MYQAWMKGWSPDLNAAGSNALFNLNRADLLKLSPTFVSFQLFQ